MRSKAIWAFLLAVLGVSVYAANVLATPATGFTGTTLAKATYGEVFSHVHTVPASWSEKIPVSYTHLTLPTNSRV